METIDLESRVKEAARKVETIGRDRAQASAALRRAIMAHRPPGEVEDLEVEEMILSEAFQVALSEHFAATITLSIARDHALSMAVG